MLILSLLNKILALLLIISLFNLQKKRYLMRIYSEELRPLRKSKIGLVSFCTLTGMNDRTIKRIETTQNYSNRALRRYLYHLSELIGYDIELITKKGQPNEW